MQCPSAVKGIDRKQVKQSLNRPCQRGTGEESAQKQKGKTARGPCQRADEFLQVIERSRIYDRAAWMDPDGVYPAAHEFDGKNMTEFMEYRRENRAAQPV